MWGYAAPLVGFVFAVLAIRQNFYSFYGPITLYDGTTLAPAVAGVVLLATVIASASRFPRIALGGVLVFMAVQLLVPFALSAGRDWAVYLGPAYVVFFAASNPVRRVRIEALCTAAALGVVETVLYSSRLEAAKFLPFPMPGGESIVPVIRWWALLGGQFLVLLLGAWAVGFAIRMTADRAVLIRERAAAEEIIDRAELELTVAQERNRISRDLHDVLAHSLAVIVAQADGARYLSSDAPPPVLSALESISGAARRALIDAQHVIENVSADDPGGPQPGLGDVDGLIAEMRRGHLRIERTDTGDARPLGTGQELAVYRILQESLTNALKHAGMGSGVQVRFDWDGPGLTIHIASTAVKDRAGAVIPAGNRLGRGIPGLRERARLAGGWLKADADGGVFRTTAFIPYDTPPADDAPDRPIEAAVTGR